MADKEEGQTHKDFGAIGNLRYKTIKYLDEKVSALRELNKGMCEKLPGLLTSEAGCAATHDAMMEVAAQRLPTPAGPNTARTVKGK